MNNFMQEFLTVAEEIRRLIFQNFDVLPLSKSEFLFLKTLENCEKNGAEVTTTALSAYTDISKSAVSQTARNLKKKGLIFRQPDRKDHRKSRMRMTESGREALTRQEDEIMCYYGKIFDEMGEENCRQLIDLLRQFVRITKSDKTERAE